ncbi:MAG: hypothetical protein PVH92_11830, partial [Anaerolineales bacterium]
MITNLQSLSWHALSGYIQKHHVVPSDMLFLPVSTFNLDTVRSVFTLCSTLNYENLKGSAVISV